MIKRYVDQPLSDRDTAPAAALVTPSTTGNGRDALGLGGASCLDLGQSLMEQGHYGEALIYLERSNVGNCVDGAIALAVCQLHLQRPAAALETCNQALEIYPHHPQALLFKGVALHRLGQYRAAYAYYRRASPASQPARRRWSVFQQVKHSVKNLSRWMAKAITSSQGYRGQSLN
ncbi:MAG: tetratricopeptide repeat protein [Leptolyngbya sp. RL_3_1]|nr:tetratricopeptide repeat protein [Leptolyngbya sp. RL_3_1]